MVEECFEHLILLLLAPYRISCPIDLISHPNPLTSSTKFTSIKKVLIGKLAVDLQYLCDVIN